MQSYNAKPPHQQTRPHRPLPRPPTTMSVHSVHTVRSAYSVHSAQSVPAIPTMSAYTAHTAASRRKAKEAERAAALAASRGEMDSELNIVAPPPVNIIFDSLPPAYEFEPSPHVFNPENDFRVRSTATPVRTPLRRTSDSSNSSSSIERPDSRSSNSTTSTMVSSRNGHINHAHGYRRPPGHTDAGFKDVAAITACEGGHDTKLSGGQLAGTIVLLPWSAIYHVCKKTRSCRRCGLVVEKRRRSPFE